MKTLRFNRQSIRLAMAALFMACLLCGGSRNARAASPVKVYSELSAAMADAAVRIKSVVSAKVTHKTKNSVAVVLGQFKLESTSDVGGNAASSGPGIANSLAEALDEEKVSVRYGAHFSVEGTYSPSTAPLGGDVEQTALNIKLSVKDDNSSLLLAMNVKITDIEQVGQLLGVTVDMSGEQPKESQLAVSIQQPQAKLTSTEIYAGENSQFGMEILVKNKMTGRYEPCEPTETSGVANVPLSNGDIYAVRVINKSDRAVAVKIGIDGLSMFAFSKHNYKHFIVPAGKSATIPGWHRDNQTSNMFLVGEYGKGSATKLLHSEDTIGMINVSFRQAWKPADRSPQRSRGGKLASTQGPTVNKGYRPVRMMIDLDPIALITVRYANSPVSK